MYQDWMKAKYDVGPMQQAQSQDDSSVQPAKTREEILGKRKSMKKTSTLDVEMLAPLNPQKVPKEKAEKEQEGESKEEFDMRLNSSRVSSISSRKETRRLLQLKIKS